MAIHIALNHKTHYRYDRPVMLGPQTIRLRPAPHCRTPILAYSLKVLPQKHFINWQQDPQANYLARLVFPEKTTEFSVEVDLVAEMAIFNPFDFFLEPYAEKIPFVYESSLARELRPFLEAETPGPKLAAFPNPGVARQHPNAGFPGQPEPAGAARGRLCHPTRARGADMPANAHPGYWFLP